jgi:hypothetical protein
MDASMDATVMAEMPADVADMQMGGGKALPKMTKEALYMRAKKAGIKGRSTMSKAELVVALRAYYKEFAKRFMKKSKK